MTYPFSGERVEVVANAMASAVGMDLRKMAEEERQQMRRFANAALYRLGGEGAAQQQGVQHLGEAFRAISEALNLLFQEPAFQMVGDELQDRLSDAAGAAFAMGKAVIEDYQAAQIEVRNAALEKRPVMTPAAPEEPEEEEAI